MKKNLTILNRKWYEYLLWSFVIVGILLSSWQALERHHLEQRVNQVELIVEYNELLEAIARRGVGEVDMAHALATLQEHGVAGILFKEETVVDIRNKGEALIFQGTELIAAYKSGRSTGWQTVVGDNGQLDPFRLYVEIYDEELWQRVSRSMSLKTKGLTICLEPSNGQPGVLSTPLEANELMLVGVGFPAQTISELGAEGFRIWLQMRDWVGVREESLQLVLADIDELPYLHGIFFNDATIPGIPRFAPVIAGAIDSWGVPVATVDLFEKQRKQISSLVRSMGEREVVRLHTIGQRELAGMTKERALNRFELAVTERNNRLLLIRMFGGPETGMHWFNLNMQFIDKLSQRLEMGGHPIGTVEPYTSLPFSKLNILLISMGVLGGGALLINRFGLPRLSALLFLAGLAVVLLLLMKRGFFLGQEPIYLVRKLMALGSVIVFPALSVSYLLDAFGNKSIGRSVLVLVKMTAFSLIGALLMVGLLADLTYIVKVEQFLGVKVAHTLPILLVIGYLFLIGLRQDSTRKQALAVVLGKIRSFLGQPLLVGTSIGLGILAVVGLVYLSRTGNESAFVSGFELQMRTVLDQVLGVRPRTKEFLIGHPLMLIALYYGFKYRYGAGVLILGMIGQVSLVNTFAHIHTPLVVSIIRTGYGLLFGIAFGVAAILAINLILSYTGKQDWEATERNG